MVYVSFVEIFESSFTSFEKAGHTESDSYAFATTSFFAGIVFYKIIDCFVHLLDGNHSHDVDVELLDLGLEGGSPMPGSPALSQAQSTGSNIEAIMVKEGEHSSPQHSHAHSHAHNMVVNLKVSGVVHPSPLLDTMDLEMVGRREVHRLDAAPLTPHRSGSLVTSRDTEEVFLSTGVSFDESTTEAVAAMMAAEDAAAEEAKLVKMSLMTALAIGIHNFPEGLATFIGALDNSTVGISLAIAIGIHNIPEGVCVAVPVYYATGSRVKAFLWSLLSGISEPLGAGLGWLFLKDHFSDNMFGVMFGLVGGMMVVICVQELLPTALRYDPANQIVSNFFILGMLIMALSMVLFYYS
jgi:ZIP family zinc transporter